MLRALICIAYHGTVLLIMLPVILLVHAYQAVRDCAFNMGKKYEARKDQ